MENLFLHPDPPGTINPAKLSTLATEHGVVGGPGITLAPTPPKRRLFFVDMSFKISV